jgi:hypothetical protein
MEIEAALDIQRAIELGAAVLRLAQRNAQPAQLCGGLSQNIFGNGRRGRERIQGHKEKDITLGGERFSCLGLLGPRYNFRVADDSSSGDVHDEHACNR